MGKCCKKRGGGLKLSQRKSVRKKAVKAEGQGAGSKAVNTEGQELKLSQRRIKLPRVWGKLP
jgi:hypothetical protein